MDSALDKLFGAVEDGDVESARLLIQQGDCLKDPAFATCAFFYDWTELAIIRLLAEAGADINAINDIGEWALRNAAEEGDAEAVTYLLSVGADPLLQNSLGTPIHMAVCSDKTEIVRLLLEAGANINAQDGDKWTCLWWARSFEMAAFLLDHGADPSIPAWETIGQSGPFPEDFESIPDAARDLMRTHRLKKPQPGS